MVVVRKVAGVVALIALAGAWFWMKGTQTPPESVTDKRSADAIPSPEQSPLYTLPTPGAPMLPIEAKRLDAFILEADKDPSKREIVEAAVGRSEGDTISHVEAAQKTQPLSADTQQWLSQMIARQRVYYQQRQRKLQRAVDDTQWCVNTALAAYEAVGQKDARWDDLAREAITRFYKTTDLSNDRTSRLLNQCLSLGCKDPLIRYLASRSLGKSHPPVAAQVLNVGQTTSELAQSPYPASCKVSALNDYMLKFDNASGEGEARWMSQIYQLWPEMAGEKMPVSRLLNLARQTTDSAMMIAGQDRKTPYDVIQPVIEAALPDSPTSLVYQGRFYIDYAWDARGRNSASTVTSEGWKLMAERLAVAEQALTKAWEMAPDEPEAAEAMLKVVLGQQKDRAAMELWFNRAIHADPNDLAAYEQKMLYLEPKWNGSAQEMIDFGHECFETHNWGDKVPLELSQAHRILSQNLDADQRRSYFQNPEVWHDMQRVYEPMHRLLFGDAVITNDYTYYACCAQQWALANQLFKSVKMRLPDDAFGSEQTLTAMRAEAASQ